MKKVAVIALILSGIVVTAAPAQAARIDVFAHRSGIESARVGGWTRGYSRVFFLTRVHSGSVLEPSHGHVVVHCQNGFRRSDHWYDRDGSMTRYMRIPRPSRHGRCTEHINA